ncbi:MAG: tetratricopeptide repeat protein [Gemmataceae bacterium]
MLAQSRIGQGDFEAAARTLDEVVRGQPDFEPALLAQAVLRFKQGKLDDAIAALSGLARRSNPETRQAALYYLAMSLNQAGRTKEAQVAFERLASDQRATRFRTDASQLPDDRDLQVRAARALLDADYEADAVKVLEDATARLGPWPAALTLLAECFDRQGKKDRADEVRRRLSGS